jgi:Fuc2NAc and GlcNAc transferase
LGDPTIIIVFSGLLGALGAWLIIKLGWRLGLMDRPNARKSHSIPTPKGGGIGILAAFLLASFLLNIPAAFWLPAIIVSVVGLLADRVALRALTRLLIQFGAALMLVLSIYHNPGADIVPILLIPFWAVYLVGTANFFNFMDGINGISAITAVIAFSLIFAYQILEGRLDNYTVLAGCIAAGGLGFLPFNLPKAKVFMGDVGSVLLGFTFAAYVFAYTTHLSDFVCLAAFILPIYLDELTTMWVRIRDRENLFKAHRRHVYQLLANEAGLAHWKVSASYGLFQLVVGLSILTLRPYGLIAALVALAVYTFAFVTFSLYIRRRLEK